MAGRSLRASATGIQVIRKAIKLNDWKQDELKDELGLKTRQPITRLLQGEPIERATFEELCHLLGLNVEDVAVPETKDSLSNSDTDELVREVRSRCCEKIRTTCNFMQLYNCSSIHLQQLFVPILLSQELSNQRESNRNKPPLFPALDIINQHQYLLILGKPGAGKSTFVNYLAINACEECTNANLVPVLIRLIDIDTRQPFRLMELIETAFDTDNTTTEKILKSSNLFLIIDGLDEVSSQFRQDVCQEVNNLIQSSYINKVIITCRTEVKDYKVSSLFQSVEIADFSREQQQQFIENWFSILSKESKSWLAARIQQNPQCNSQELNQYIFNHQPIQELSKTPILLSFICLLYVSDGYLPEKRSLLYERGIDILLEQWDENRGVENRVEISIYKNLSLDDKRKILQELALYTFERSENPSEIEQTEVLTVIAQHWNDSHQGLNLSSQDAFQILEGIAADHGLLFQSARKKWSFSHLTFQEYFVAQWFVQPQEWDRLCQHIVEPRWREVFLLVTEMLNPADDWLRLLKQQVDGLLIGDEKLQQCLSWVKEKTNSVDVPYKPVATRAFYFVSTLAPWFNLTLACFLDVNLANDFAQACAYLLPLDLMLQSGLQTACVLANDYDRDAAGARTRAIDCNLAFALYYHLDSGLQCQLQLLREELPDTCEPSQLIFWKGKLGVQNWWKENGQTWTAKLRTLMIRYRNIGHDWQFSNQQIEKLKQYYNANELLIDCLNNACNISPNLCQEIEDTLLLPITRTPKSGS